MSDTSQLQRSADIRPDLEGVPAARCIPGCTVDHTTQPAGLWECSATDSVGAVRGSAPGMTPAYVAVNRWQNAAGVGGEVVVHGPERAVGDSDAEPMTFAPAQARMLGSLLIDAAHLVDTNR